MGPRTLAVAVVSLSLGSACHGGPGAESASGGSGTGSLEEPILRCGAEESYAYVAREFQCPDGSNPFRGDLAAAQRSRVGTKENPSTGHPVDLYDVPCPSRPIRVFIDLYDCEEHQAGLAAAQSAEFSEAVDQAFMMYGKGEYQQVLSHCEAVWAANQHPMDRPMCSVLTIAAMLVTGMNEGARSRVTRACSTMPPASQLSDARAAHLALVMMLLAQSQKVDADAAMATLAELSAACEVDPNRVVELLMQLQKETEGT